MSIPAQPLIYHITHVENLPSILEGGGLWPDATMIDHGGPVAPIGMNSIKARRLGLPVKCHPGDHVGEYVPFNFCPRSVMLYILHCANHPELAYRGGQEPILHLEYDLHEVVAWAEAGSHRWAFSLTNAGARYTEFHQGLERLSEVDWQAVAATDFRDPQVKDRKQAEFLLRDFAPWTLVRRIGVHSATVQSRVLRIISGTAHRPLVEIRRNWYY